MKRHLLFAFVLLAAAAAPALWLASVVPVEGLNLPSDDAWIHQVFARNLARAGMFAYNAGERSAGVTAPLWTMILSETYFFRLPPVWAAIAMAVAAHMLWVAAIYWLVLGIWPDRSRRWAAAAALLFTLFGPVVWFSVSGMETSLFFALATLAAAALGRGRHAWAGFAAAASVPVRPEGSLLVAMLFGWWLIRLWRERRRPLAGEVVGYVVLPILFVAPLVAHNLAAGGSVMPTTYFGRHWLYLGTEANQRTITWRGPHILAFYWYRYIQVWTLGQNDISNAAKIFTDPVVLSQLGLWGAVILLVRRRLAPGLAFFTIWVFLHNSFYGLFLPNFGTAGRYEGCNYALFAVAIIFGARLLLGWMKERAFKVIPYVLLAAAFVSAFGSYLVWREMYSDNIYHLTNVHEAAGKWVAANLPADARVAAFDIGAFGYYADRYIVDIGGLLDRDAGKYLSRGDVTPYLRKKGAGYIAMMEVDSPELRPLGERLGIYEKLGTELDMTLVKSWELPLERRRWLSITAIAYPTLSLYRLYFRGDN